MAGDTAGRPIIELIQNADDAMQEAKEDCKNRRVLIILEEDKLLIANDGAPFTKEGVEAICNLDRSPKKDPRITIGNKGIGFKSVLSWTETPSIYSTSHKFTFDRQKSAEEIAKALNGSYASNNVPLMRLPFETITIHNYVKTLFDEGFITVIALAFKNKKVYEVISAELNQFDPLTLLFLNAVSELKIMSPAFEHKITVVRERNEILIEIDGEAKKYKLFKHETQVPYKISISLPDDHPSRLNSQCILHSDPWKSVRNLSDDLFSLSNCRTLSIPVFYPRRFYLGCWAKTPQRRCEQL